MKITEIRVDRFGVWRNVTFPLHGDGLNVVYGPNEAGKSTLMRFIRSVLYGFDSLVGTPENGSQVWDGSLNVVHEGQTTQIRRAWRQGTRGFVSLTGPNDQTPAHQLLSSLLSETDETIFNSVFAVGLQELQELSTLNDDQVAGHVYGLTLGPDGQRLLEVTEEVRRRRDALLDENTESGELAELLTRDEDLTLELQELAGNRQRHAELCNRRHALEAEIADLKQRQSGIRSQLRGHLFLERVWAPWNDVREFEAQLAEIPHVASFPEGGTARLEELDRQIAEADAERAQLVAKIKDVTSQANELQQSTKFRRRVASLRTLLGQRGTIETAFKSLAALDEDAMSQREMLDLHLAELGPGWSPERLKTIDTSPAATHRGLQRARAYQTSAALRHRLRRRHDRLKKACQRQSDELTERLKSFGGTSLEEELASTRRRLQQLETFGTLQVRESELELQLSGLRRSTARLEGREAIPTWVAFLLTFLLIAGGLIAILGFIAGFALNSIAGAALVLVGLTGCGIGYGMKRHGEIETDEELEQLKEDTRTVEVQLRETRESLMAIENAECEGASAERGTRNAEREEKTGWPGLDRREAPVSNASAACQLQSDSENHAALIAACSRRLFELEQMSAVDAGIQARRRRLSERRLKIREAHRRLGDARQQWCEFVVGIGLPETVKVDDAFAAWQRVVEAREAHSKWEQAATGAEKQRRKLNSFQNRCERLANDLSLGSFEAGHPLAALDFLSRELQVIDEKRKQRSGLLKESRQCRRTFRRLNSNLSQTRREWSALLVKGGAADREEFLARASHSARRKEIEEYLTLAEAELEASASTEPDLAIVEEDLQDFNRELNSEHIEVLQREQEDLQGDLQQSYEQLGSLKQTIAGIEDDRRSTRLRCERSQVRHELKRTMERWLALNLAGRTVDAMRTRFERTCQPPTLAAAGEFLTQLTAGRYSTIWTPLGKRHLCIDDDRGNSFRVEQLSNGTREQLFLAIRFAMVREFSRRGIELPLVLDDILVNFDQERTEAAVDALMKFVADGQQVLLFTCHQHLAQLFQSKGIEPTWLERHKTAVEERLAG